MLESTCGRVPQWYSEILSEEQISEGTSKASGGRNGAMQGTGNERDVLRSLQSESIAI